MEKNSLEKKQSYLLKLFEKQTTMMRLLFLQFLNPFELVKLGKVSKQSYNLVDPHRDWPGDYFNESDENIEIKNISRHLIINITL